jgi:hypothetical protein
VGALIATLWRIGWGCASSASFRDDTGESLDLLRMSPALVAAAVHRSVERWRLKRVVATLPTIAAARVDTPDSAVSEGVDDSFDILATRPIASLLKGKARPPDTVPHWSAACRSQLLSASTGGQCPRSGLRGFLAPPITSGASYVGPLLARFFIVDLAQPLRRLTDGRCLRNLADCSLPGLESTELIFYAHAAC